MIVVDETQLNKIIEEYKGVSKENILKWVEEKCEYYSKMKQDTLEKFGFEKGMKKEFNNYIKDFIFLIDNSYKEIDYNHLNKKLLEKVVSSYFDKSDLSKQIWKVQPYFYDNSKMWWIWNKNCFMWKLVDETDILNLVNEKSTANTVSAKEKGEIIESMKQFGRKKIPKPIKKNWVQFKNIIVDLINGDEFEVSPEYFVTNPIPYKLHTERFTETPIMNKIFEEWVGKDYVKTLYEIISYCLLPNYPMHRIFCLLGGGLNGKSKFLELLRKFVGKENCCSTELDILLTSRFEITKLHKKLICQMGETNFNEISKTSILKKLSGGDLIGFEYKNKNPFEEINYAKIIIATNNLPTTTDKTIGFYRRWLIIDFPNRFSEKIDILSEIPEEEYESLAVKSLGILKDLLDKRGFHNEGSIETRMEKYEEKSNFLGKFLKLFTEENLNEYITKADFFRKFSSWCKENKFRELSETSLGMAMKKLGIETEKKYFNWMYDGKGGQARVWEGIKWIN